MPPVLIGVVIFVGIVVVLVLAAHRSRPAPVHRDTRPPAPPGPTGFGSRLSGIFHGDLGAEAWRRLEDLLVAADVGVPTATALVAAVREERPAGEAAARQALRQAMLAVFERRDRSLRVTGQPAVIVVVGVNGSGKTTTIAKLAARLADEGRSVLLGGADTFRAAAADQLRVWGDRLGVDVVTGQHGADPASVAYDAIVAGRARGHDVVIVDTAGRLHDKTNLMDELAKVMRVVARDAPPDEVLLVLDGTTGQNGIAQARSFTGVAGVTGVVISKLDGSSRGGAALAVERELGVPIKLVGVGEGPGDLRDFDPEAFVDGLLETP